MSWFKVLVPFSIIDHDFRDSTDEKSEMFVQNSRVERKVIIANVYILNYTNDENTTQT